jgi:hypothetical protein
MRAVVELHSTTLAKELAAGFNDALWLSAIQRTSAQESFMPRPAVLRQ